VTDTIADTVAAVWRIESARLTAALARRTGGDLALAEDLASDTFAAALRQWPVDGVPRHPGSWLMATAHHRLVDHARRRTTGDRKLTLYAAGQPERHDPTEEVTDMLDDPVRDDELTLILMSCHPKLSRDNQIALTLKVVAGLQTAEIARAFLLSETTAAQRIVRAKRRLATAGARFEMPGAADLPARLGVVLAVIYAIFNEGYASAAGEDWTRPELCHDALRLGRRVVALQPDHPEARGLVALMELQASRLPARHSADGSPVLLEDQDRRRWDRLLIRRGLEDLAQAGELGGGPYTLQAEIAACHARAAESPRPTGAASPPSTWSCATSRRHRSWISTTPSPPPGPTGRPRVSSGSMRSPRSTACSATRCSTPPAATCSSGWAASRKRPPPSTGPPTWRPTRPSALSSPAAPSKGMATLLRAFSGATVPRRQPGCRPTRVTVANLTDVARKGTDDPLLGPASQQGGKISFPAQGVSALGVGDDRICVDRG
jgi:RNA polymerase sigma factor (sigma-70 family)